MASRRERTAIFIAYINLFLVLISATNHWILTKEGKIQPQYDSPFYMQRPNDLSAFLNQSKNQILIDSLYSELVLIKTDIRAKLGDVEAYALGFLQQTKCMMKYILEEGDLFASIGTKKYMDRIYLGEQPLQRLMSDEAVDLEPNCTEYLDLDYLSLFCFDHLDALYDRASLQIDPEDPLKLHELGIINDYFVNMLVTGLRTQATSWQYYTLASYYWRLHGNALQAVECARRALYLVPRDYKDIPLLSLGTILQRARRHQDAVVVLDAATDLNSRSAESYFALGNSLFFLSDFNRSIQAYDRARKLDDAFKARVDYIESALDCFKQAKSKQEFDLLFHDLSEQLRRYEEKKQLLEEYLKKMLQQQVPLDEREYFKRPEGSDLHANENLVELAQQRGQYCSSRISPETNEPELFCDFVYDLHMKLEADDIRVDVIQTYLEQTADVMKSAKSSLGVFDLIDLSKLEGDRGTVPPDDDDTAEMTTGLDEGAMKPPPKPYF